MGNSLVYMVHEFLPESRCWQHLLPVKLKLILEVKLKDLYYSSILIFNNFFLSLVYHKTCVYFLANFSKLVVKHL